MIGFTIVLNKKRRRHYIRKEKNRRKILYFLPVIFIAIFSLVISFFIKKDETENEIYTQRDIQVFKSVDNYSAYYNSVVINEFFSYKKGDEIENEMLVRLGVWSILCTEERTKYEAFDGTLSIRKEEIEERVRLLFSDNAGFENASSGEIIFDKKSECYIVPVIGFSPEYSAVLESVKAEKGRIKLTVECLKSESFKQDGFGKTVLPEADKKIIIILARDEKSYFIEEVKEV